MTYQTFTRTRTDTISHSEVRYVMSKIASDLFQLRIFHGSFTEQYEDNLRDDLYQWLYSGYAEQIKIRYYKSSTAVVRFEIKYGIDRWGGISTDEDAGSIPYIDLSKSRFEILVSTTSEWDNLAEQGKINFYDRLNLNWGFSRLKPIYQGGYWGNNRTYSKENLAANRSIYVGQ
jgi:hypothetical protein